MDADSLTSLFFGVFVLLLIVAATTTVGRVAAKLYWGVPLPRLLIRDAITMGGLTLPFLLIFAVRTLDPDLKDALRTDVLWILVTSIPAIISLATYVYFEIWVIGPPVKESRLDALGGLETTSINEYKEVG